MNETDPHIKIVGVFGLEYENIYPLNKNKNNIFMSKKKSYNDKVIRKILNCHDNALNEIKIYKLLNNNEENKLFCNMLDYFIYDNKINIILSYVDKSIDLFYYISINNNIGDSMFKSKQRYTNFIKICSNVADAIKYLHDRDIVHFDIKPENVVVCENLNIYLIDFEFSKKTEKEFKVFKIIGTPTYMSPEMMNKQNVFKYSDIFSYGIMLYIIFFPHFSKNLFNDTCSNHITKRLEYGDTIIKEIPPYMLNDQFNEILTYLIELINNCIYVDVNKRFNIDEVIKNINIINNFLENNFLEKSYVKKD